MPERWVLNASPIIVLARVGQEHLFDALTDEFVVPRAVAEEIEAGPVNDPVLKAARREEGPSPRCMYAITVFVSRSRRSSGTCTAWPTTGTRCTK